MSPGSRFGKELAEIALEEKGRDVGVEIVLEPVLRIKAIAAVIKSFAIERAEADQEALGRGEVKIAVKIEPIGPFGDLAIAVAVVECLEGGAGQCRRR